MGNTAKDEALYQEMCRVVGKVVLEMRDLGQSQSISLSPAWCVPPWRTRKSNVPR